MMRWSSIKDCGAILLVAMLCIAATTPLAAQVQQDSAAVPEAGASTAQPATASLAGPRLRQEWRPVEPSFTSNSTTGPMAMAGSGGSHTLTVTTLVLVLIVVIAVLLIVK
jgi:hypothetical protein